jgi:hypothetical protein
MISELERTVIANHAAALRRAGCKVEVSEFTGAITVLDDPMANAEPETPMVVPQMVFDPPAAKPATAGNYGGLADGGGSTDEAPMQAPKMTFERD